MEKSFISSFDLHVLLQWQEHLSISHIIAVIIANNTSKMNYFVYYLLLELKFIFFLN